MVVRTLNGRIGILQGADHCFTCHQCRSCTPMQNRRTACFVVCNLTSGLKKHRAPSVCRHTIFWEYLYEWSFMVLRLQKLGNMLLLMHAHIFLNKRSGKYETLRLHSHLGSECRLEGIMVEFRGADLAAVRGHRD